ncbi:MAG: hypothetical protein ACR2Q3_02680 [Woeseiaceae bacterium]
MFGLLVLLASCGGDENSPENEIRAWVNRGELAAEERDRGELLDMISVNYTDAHGNDRKNVGDLLRLYFLRQDSVALLTSIDDISLSGATAAKVQVAVGMAGSSNNALGFDADAYNFEFELIKSDGDWLLIGAQWGRLGSELL